MSKSAVDAPASGVSALLARSLVRVRASLPEAASAAIATVSLAASAMTGELETRSVADSGCNTGAVDGNWNDAAQRSLSLFNRHAGTTLDVKAASLDSVDVVKGKAGRVCPLVCDRGYKADGDACVKITCKPGFQVGDDNSCEKIESDRKPVARREAPEQERPKPQAAPSPAQAPAPSRQVQTSGQVFCNQSGCQAVHKGCFIAGGGRGPAGNGGAQREVCP